LKVAIQGERGSFSHAAADKLYASPELVCCDSFAEAFAALRRGKAQAAVLPFENALFGSIHQNYDLLMHSRAPVVGETFRRIELCLLGKRPGQIQRGARVLTHPVAQGQCGAFLRRHRLRPELASDTAGAVRTLMAGETEAVYAVASALAGELYGASVIARGIEDDARNFTRFLAIGSAETLRRVVKPQFKTSLAFVLPNRAGALFKALGCFSLRDIDLAKLESRPMKGRPFEYVFYLDALARQETPAMQYALGHLREIAERVSVLGCYPRAEVP
jgi:prephenate dehydratase